MMNINDAIMKETLRRGYSPKTVKAYQTSVEKFFRQCRKEPAKVSKADVREFLWSLKEKGKSGSTINLYLNALKFFFEEVMKRKMKLDIKYSKKPKTLPIVLAREEVKRLFDAIENPRHKLMIQLLYSAGLRVSELLNLKTNALEIGKGYGWVRCGKGGKDRIFIIANSLKKKICMLVSEEKLSDEALLFMNNRSSKYSARSVQEIVRKAAIKANIKKKVHPHTLRHSFATHLIEDGSSVSELQALLGHSSPETTFVYLHTALPSMIKAKSPIDSLQ